jgi:hypothetical protein
VRPPLAFTYGNCVFATGLDDGWAAFAVRTSSYELLSQGEKHARFAALLAAVSGMQADFQILRVSRRWDMRRFVQAMSEGRDACADGHAVADRDAVGMRQRSVGMQQRYVHEQAARLRVLGASEPRVYLLVSLREPERDVATYLARAGERHPREWWQALRRTWATREGRVLGAAALARVQERAEQMRAHLASTLSVRPAHGAELQWLVRRAYCRGLGEPQIEALHEPRALLYERDGDAALAPLQGDVLRWIDCLVEHRGRSLRIESELGVSWQAQLVAGALPETAEFPGARVELMWAPVERLRFPVDLSLNARFLPNELALRIARRKIQDADQIAHAEADGEQGVSEQGRRRTQQARELLARLQSASRPPLLRATLALAVGASDEEALERRVQACRHAYGEVHLHRPLGGQLDLFWQQLPGQRTRVAGYDDTLTAEQVAAMMPVAAHAVGARRGFYLGHTLSGSRRPVLFDLREGSHSDRNTAILSVGALGSGKTTLAQKLKYEAFLLGARVIDCDPKGDHRFHLLEEVAPQVQEIMLAPDERLRGMLDPLRVAPKQLRHEAAVAFLAELLPAAAPAAWETALVGAVDRVLRGARTPTCGAVVKALREGDEVDTQVAKALAVYASSGLTQLGFAEDGRALPAVGGSQVTYLPIRDLPAPDPTARREEYTQAERVGAQLVRLIAMFAMHLMAVERERLKVFSFDEGWRLLSDPVGRTLLMSLQRMGRSELAVPIISTQLVSDALVGERSSLENLLGATFVFGMRSHEEAARALALLGLDPADEQLRARLLQLEAGRCLLRDHRGRVEAVQVEVVVRSLLRAFSTTPGAALGCAEDAA